MPVTPDVFDRLTDKTEAKIKGLRRRWALSSLEKRLAKALMIVDGHKKAGVPAGDMRYQSVQANVDLEIDYFCDTYRVDRSHIDAQIPGLKLIKDMTVPNKPRSKALIVIGTVITVLVALFLVGTAIGLVEFVAGKVVKVL